MDSQGEGNADEVGDPPAASAAGAASRARLPISGTQLERLLDVLGEAVTVTEVDGQLVFANAAALKRMGLSTLEEALTATPAQLLGPYEITREDLTPVPAEEMPGRRLLRGEPVEPTLLRLIDRTTGRVAWTLVKATEFVADTGRRLAVNVLEDVTESKEQELRATFLARASQLLASSLDPEEILQGVARLAVPQLADWCAVEMVVGDELRQAAIAHVDPAKLEFAREFRERYPPHLDEPGGVARVIRSGEPAFYPQIPEELLVAGARDPEHLRLIRELKMRSIIVVPITSRDRVIGAISLVAAETAGTFDEDDLAFAQEFAARAAVALENALLYRERSETARTLQNSLLPAHLPAVEGWRTATRYRAAERDSQIGGDFFDLFHAEDSFVVVVGDVTGKGVRAAALTALTRHSARTCALLGLSPRELLHLLNRELVEQPDLSLVTAVVAKFSHEDDHASLTLASAGHPLPLRHRAGGSPMEAGSAGVLLGFDPLGDWPEETLTVEPGDTLLFYTDGVTDALGAEDRFGERRLQELVTHSSPDPELLLEEIDNALLEFQLAEAQDDMATLAVQLLSARSWQASRAAADQPVTP